MNGDTGRFGTLIDVLAWRAAHAAGRTAFTFQGEATSYAELWERVGRFGACVQERGLRRGQCVVLALPNGPDFFTAFYGIQRAGGTAVPLFPASDPTRIARIARECNAAGIVLPAGTPRGANGDVPCLSVAEAAEARADAEFPTVGADDLAFLQYTSGSTGEPKGVMLSHANLLKNMQQMIAGMEITERDVFVSWLPAYHDMGLILMTMVPFYLGVETHLLPAELGNVKTWLKTIEARSATFTAAPDFAYRLCIRHADEEDDLSSLRVALNAAEPVRAGTITDFEAKFHLRGVMTAGYGLAEATVGVSMSKPGERPHVDVRGLVSVGRPFPEVEVMIVDGERSLSVGQVGEIAIRTPARCGGYYNSPEATRALFRPDGFLLSGDLGYMDDEGRLYIVGRKKNSLKHAGETIAPQEVEEIADAAPGVRFSAAVGIDRGGPEGEQVYVFAEVKAHPGPEESEELVIQMVAALHARLGIRPARVLLLRPHAIPRTHNGKVQHGLLKEQYVSGALRREGLVLFPEG